MIIVLEGPDNSGKSTLAKELSEILGFDIIHSGGPEKYPGEIAERMKRYQKENWVIFDRHPAISQSVYCFYTGQNSPPIELIDEFWSTRPFVIYCQGRNLEGHEINPDIDNNWHLSIVEQNYEKICQSYDSHFLTRDYFPYLKGVTPVGDVVKVFMRAISSSYNFSPFRDVKDFHEKFDLAYYGPPRLLPEKVAKFREQFIYEEYVEYSEATAIGTVNVTNHHMTENPNRQIAGYLDKSLDALVDLAYVTLGAAYLHGFDFEEAWRRVHRANMKKVRASEASQSKRNSLLDVIKPEGWKPPSHLDLVINHAHRRS